MAELRQSPGLRAQLRAAWEAHPDVAAFHAASKAHARENNLGFDVPGMNASLAFSNAWMAEHGPLPDSGIWVG